MDHYWIYFIAGLGLGGFVAWILRDALGRWKLDPNLIRGAKDAMDGIKQNYEGMLEREREERAADRTAFQQVLAERAAEANDWKARYENASALKSPVKSPVQSPDHMEEARNQIRLAMESPDENQDVRNKLQEEFGLTASETDAILKGEYDELSTGERTDLLIEDAIKKETGL